MASMPPLLVPTQKLTFSNRSGNTINSRLRRMQFISPAHHHTPSFRRGIGAANIGGEWEGGGHEKKRTTPACVLVCERRGLVGRGEERGEERENLACHRRRSTECGTCHRATR
jgi:hypothetical protein